jgi:hypothetical protein
MLATPGNPTPSSVAEAYNKTMGPANVDYQNAVNNKISAADKDIRLHIYNGIAERIPGQPVPGFILHQGQKYVDDPRLKFGSAKNKGATKKVADKAGKKGVILQDDDTSPKKDGPALDGSGIPKELEFRGRSKSSSSSGR